MPPSHPSTTLVPRTFRRLSLSPAVIVTALGLTTVAGVAAAVPGPWTFVNAGTIVALLLVTVVREAPPHTGVRPRAALSSAPSSPNALSPTAKANGAS
jgi:hypothetical protein